MLFGSDKIIHFGQKREAIYLFIKDYIKEETKIEQQ